MSTTVHLNQSILPERMMQAECYDLVDTVSRRKLCVTLRESGMCSAGIGQERKASSSNQE